MTEEITFDFDHPELLDFFDPDESMESTIIEIEVGYHISEDDWGDPVLEVEQIWWNGKEIDPPQQAWDMIHEQLDETLTDKAEDAEAEARIEDYEDRMNDPFYY